MKKRKYNVIIFSRTISAKVRGFMKFDFTDDVKIISSVHKESRAYGKIESRLAHGFIFRIKGTAEYLIEGKRVTLRSGELIFLPKGSSYEYTVEDSANSLYTSINFQATLPKARIRVYPFDAFHNSAYIAQSFTELWKFGSESDKYKCLSLLYDLLSHLVTFENLNSDDKRRYRLIEPAEKYLKRHAYDSDLKIEKLHSLCGISDTYFRRIFTSKFGMSPQAYLQNERINYAKSLIESGDYATIAEVAEAVGYNDPLYFSKAFKKFYGISPTAYEEMLVDS